MPPTSPTTPGHAAQAGITLSRFSREFDNIYRPVTPRRNFGATRGNIAFPQSALLYAGCYALAEASRHRQPDMIHAD